MIIVFHGIGNVSHKNIVSHGRAIEICDFIKPTEVHFDDAEKSAFKTVLALKKLEYNVKIFIPVAFIGKWFIDHNYFAYEVMDVQRLEDLVYNGITLGSHTVSHRDTNHLPLYVLERELIDSKEHLESKLKTEINDFSFPFAAPYDKDRRNLALKYYKNVYGLDGSMMEKNGNFNDGIIDRYPVSSTHIRKSGVEYVIEERN